jgi:hypothetical protein
MIRPVFKNKIVIILISVILIYFILSIPESSEQEFKPAGKKAFVWDLDSLWKNLEKKFREARKSGCDKLRDQIDNTFTNLDHILGEIEGSSKMPDDDLFKELEEEMFNLAPMIGACDTKLSHYFVLFSRIRKIVKQQSLNWDMNSKQCRDRIYRLFYGGRAALEEVMLQVPANKNLNLVHGSNVRSETPMASILGVNIHSGDILVSRGGAPTSALIARGSDYPGNFSHVALVYVDAKTHLASIIEAHIERGVTISSLGDYIKDKKLRVMVLRLRPGLKGMVKDPMMPHKVAQYARDDAKNRHIPYDFEMDYNNHEKIFCSEVVSAAYRRFGIQLWMGISRISSPGLASWLADFGVKNFETQEPSDLEYDPQLKVVAEWRDRETLYKDHLDNAVIDVMLEGAEKGDQLTYKWYLLAVSRCLKGYSSLLNVFGGVGPIPEGMSATSALKNSGFSERHTQLKEELVLKAKKFKEEYGYIPPYWELVNLVRSNPVPHSSAF